MVSVSSNERGAQMCIDRCDHPHFHLTWSQLATSYFWSSKPSVWANIAHCPDENTFSFSKASLAKGPRWRHEVVSPTITEGWYISNQSFFKNLWKKHSEDVRILSQSVLWIVIWKFKGTTKTNVKAPFFGINLRRQKWTNANKHRWFPCLAVRKLNVPIRNWGLKRMLQGLVVQTNKEEKIYGILCFNFVPFILCQIAKLCDALGHKKAQLPKSKHYID